MAPIRQLFTAMPPMLDALAQQTNVQLPSYMPQARVPSNQPHEKETLRVQGTVAVSIRTRTYEFTSQ